MIPSSVPPPDPPLDSPAPSPRLSVSDFTKSYIRTALRRRFRNAYRYGYAQADRGLSTALHVSASAAARVSLGHRRHQLPRPGDDLAHARGRHVSIVFNYAYTIKRTNEYCVVTGGALRRTLTASGSGLRYASRAAIAWRTVFGSMKRTSSRITSNSETSLGAALAEERDEALDELLGRAGAGGDADHALALEPLVADLALVVDQVRLGAEVARDVDEALASWRSSGSRSRARGRTRRPSA